MGEHSMVRRSWEWFRMRAHGTHAKAWLFVLCYTEAFISLIVPDPLLALMASAVPNKWLRATLIATLAATLGAITGYLVGALMFDSIGERLIEWYGLQSEAAYASELLGRSVFWVTLIVAFTPFPDKVFVILAGFLGLNPVVMTIAFAIGRGARFGLVGYFSAKYGERLMLIMLRVFENPLFAIIGILFLVLIFLWYA